MLNARRLRLICCGARLWRGERCSCINENQNNSIVNQSQKHGFTFENEIRHKVFGLPSEPNDRNVHDIPAEKNKLNPNENISIKTTGSSTICCGDVLRFFGYDFSQRNTMICIQYSQGPSHKTVDHIYEIDYNADCHRVLFGDMPEEAMRDYVDGVKSIPVNVKGDEAKKTYDYLNEKKKMNAMYSNVIQINPKVDSKQSRVQCSIPNFEKTLAQFITYKSSIESPNMVRGVEIVKSIESGRRKRNKKKEDI
jgi:hypothetical protein